VIIKSKAQIEKIKELVALGKVSQADFDVAVMEVKPEELPERVEKKERQAKL